LLRECVFICVCMCVCIGVGVLCESVSAHVCA